ncbi:S8 family serine peptidase [Alkalibacillus salilacus]|uniref:Minor extracellular serine protease Vpr n=1 Tax=Alkalibacillus salilacus TaxID=284582 RepID=A0ABT9VGC6_9BACI|nr:S8 family serine peptidase [Alkalibacillus salilacus]MDQ0160027.1 minor extracellular serine protease Vpr [Alkalibacillus salilacus]
MSRRSHKFLLGVTAFLLALSVFIMSTDYAEAKGKGKSKGQNKHQDTSEASGELQKTGTIHGEFDYESDELVTVIIEMTSPSVLEGKHQNTSVDRDALKEERDSVIERIQSISESSEVNREYDYVFSGFSLEVKQSDIRAIASVNGVEAVYPNVKHEVTKVDEQSFSQEEVSPEMIDTAPHIGAPDVWEDLGYTGEGVTVGVIDTGVDYTHPDLDHAFGDYKGYDFVDQDQDPQETQPEQGEVTNHGSHVAGTIAANGVIQGVAPEVDLLGYRVLGPGGSGATDNVIAGIERAVEDGVDVMNLSLGNTNNDPDFATALALDNAMQDGVVAVSSNGNSGPNDWTVGSPGTSREAISVGASELPYMLYNVGIDVNGLSADSADVMGTPSSEALQALNEGDYELAQAGLGSADEVAEVDLEGKIALVERGEYPFVDKAENVAAAGAVGMVIYNNEEGTQPRVGDMAIPTIKMSQADGAALVDSVEAGDNTVTFNIEEDGLSGETIADFSSRGPVTDSWMIKPDVSAPGVNVISTVPTHNDAAPHAYAAMSGTSMAAPHVAGAAALVVQANEDWDVDEVKGALMNTAEPLEDLSGERYPNNTQGAGSIRIPEAITTDTLMAPGSYSFGTFEKDNGKEVERQHFEIENLSNERKRYDMDVTLFDGNDHIKVNTSNNLNVKAGGTQKVNMNVQVDAGKLDGGYYEGLITLKDNDETIEIPTVLFVQDPYDVFEIDDLMAQGDFTLDQGIFDVTLGFNYDIEYVDFAIYDSGLSAGAVIAQAGAHDAGENNFTIDASPILPQLPAILPSDGYNFVVFVGKGDKEEGWVLGEFDLEE